MSAAGQYIPPLLIFPQKRWQAELLDGAPPGSIGACSDSGWVTGPLFSKWFEHFISIVKPSKEKPVVLVLDGHYSHTRNLEVIDRARETGVSIVCLPPHSTDKLQPLDVAFMFPLKTRYAQAIENWLASNPHRIVRKLQVAKLLGESYLRAATLETAVNGFRKTGIHPFNPNIFQEHDFIARQLEEEPEDSNDEGNQDNENVPAPPQVISPRDIKPVPVIQPSTSSRAGTSFLVTGSDHKSSVKSSMEKKQMAEARQKKRSQSNVKKRLSTEDEDQPKTLSKKPPRKKTKKYDFSSSDSEDETQVPLVSTDDEDSSDDEDVACPICGRRFSQDKGGEKWVKCSKCFKWNHELCSSSSTVKKFVCDFCLD